MYKILIADDEPKLLYTLCDYFNAKGFLAIPAQNGEEAVMKAADNMPDVIILDVMMPETDGLAACREIREFCDAPVIFLSALGEEEDLLRGYDGGADDYIVKPFPLSVLLKKCSALLARFKGADAEHKLTAGGLTAILDGRALFDGVKSVSVSQKDFDLLVFLMQHRGRTLSRDTILNRVWGYGFDGDARVVDTHIKQLRRALGDKAAYIVTVTGVGYRFEEESI